MISEWMCIKQGVRRGYVVSPQIFSYTEMIMMEVGNMDCFKICRIIVYNLRYADDTIIIAESEEQI